MPSYPVPWAESRATSFLLTKAETLAALERNGYASTAWNDVTGDVVTWFANGGPAAGPHGLSLGALMGPRFGEMTRNLASNLRDGSLRVVMGTARRT